MPTKRLDCKSEDNDWFAPSLICLSKHRAVCIQCILCDAQSDCATEKKIELVIDDEATGVK